MKNVFILFFFRALILIGCILQILVPQLTFPILFCFLYSFLSWNYRLSD